MEIILTIIITAIITSILLGRLSVKKYKIMQENSTKLMQIAIMSVEIIQQRNETIAMQKQMLANLTKKYNEEKTKLVPAKSIN